MNKIQLDCLEIENFMGYAKCRYNFDIGGKVTEIKADFGNGKTSLEMAWRWVLGLTIEEFAPKIDGYRIKNIITKVKATIIVNGLKYNLQRTAEQHFNKDGNFDKYNYGYEFDNQATKQTIYQDKIVELCGVPFEKFDMLFSMKGFNANNGTKWTWKQKRQELFEKMDIDSQVATLADLPEFNLLANDLKKGKKNDEIQSILNTQKKLIQKQLDMNDHDIKVASASMVEFQGIDFSSLKAKEKELQAKLSDLESQKLQANRNAVINQKYKELTEVQEQLREIDSQNFLAQTQQNKLKNDLQFKIQDTERTIRLLNEKISRLENDIEYYQIELAEAKKTSFNQADTICPTCKQELPQSKKDELLATFEERKAKSIAEINSKVSNLTVERQNAIDKINIQTDELARLKADLSRLNSIALEIIDTKGLYNKIDNIQAQIEELKTKAVKAEVEKTIAETNEQIKNCHNEQFKENELNKLRVRVENLKNENADLFNQETQRQTMQDQLNLYIQQKVKLVNEKVNEYFDGICFNFFKWNSANADNPYDCTCECTYNGTVYDSCSSGQKVFCDFAVNNGLQKLYNVDFPQFIDNSQDITIELKSGHQRIKMETVKGENIKAIRIKDIYSIADCDLVNKGE